MLSGTRGAAAVLLGALAAVFPASATAAPGQVVPGSYIVTLRAGDPGAVAGDHGRRYGAAVDHVYRNALRGYAAHMSAAAARRVAADDRVASVMPDQAVSIDAQTLPTGIDRIDGELSSAVSGDGAGAVNVDIAILDTGIDATHPDLTVVGGVNCSTGGSFQDGNGHGTHVAGTAAAKDDDTGVVGVAPGARLHAARVLNNAGSGSFASVICGIDWVTARAATIEVANMSLSGGGRDTGCNGDPFHAAICASVKAGITYAVAAGNQSVDAATRVPASYDEVITVSALADFDGQPGGLGSPTCRTDEDDTFANFSNFGADIDLIAPGVCILSTWKNRSYNTISGTSMATPHVTGAAALYKSTRASAPPIAVKTALRNAATLNWFTATDPDGTPDRLLNVDPF
jgi:subtilisin